MQSFAQMNGQHQHVGQPSQAFQAAAPLAQDAMKNHVWLTGDMYNYMTLNSGIQPSERGNVASHNGAYSQRQGVTWQNSAAPSSNQVVHSQNGGRHKLLKELLNHGQSNSSQKGNACPTVINGFPAALPQTFNQNSANQSHQNTINTKTMYLQQNMSSCWKPLAAQRTNVQAGQMMYRPQTNGVQQGFYQNANVGLKRDVSAYTTAAASPVVNPNMVVHNGQTGQVPHNQIPRETSTEQRFSPSYQASHAMATSPSSRINGMMAQPSNAQTLYASNMSQSTQQHTAQTHLTFNNWTNTSASNTHLMSQSVARYVGATNELPPHPNVEPQQMPRPKQSTGSQYTSYNTGSDRHPPPAYHMHHHVDRAGQSNWNTQTGTSHPSSEGLKMNNIQPLPLTSGQSLPQSPVSRGQHTVNAQLLQKSLTNISSVTSVENVSGRGETDCAYLPKNDAVSTGSSVELLSNASHQMNVPEGVSLQGFKMSFTARYAEIVKVLGYNTPVLQNDSSTHSSPSHTANRVVAVVQPLSQENSWNATTCESGKNQEKDCISPDVTKNKEALSMTEQASLHTENQYQMISSNAKSSDVTTLQSSESEVHNSIRTSESETEVAAVAENPTEATAVQGCPTKNDERATPPSPAVTDLSSLPTTPWTAEDLTKLIDKMEKAQKMPEDVSKHDSLLMRFWNGNYGELCFIMRSLLKTEYLSRIQNYFEANIRKETVLLSQVKQSQLKLFHVLKDNEVYSEPPYKSSWLNLNDQLDDIDKDFGLSWAFKRHQSVVDADSQTDRVKKAESGPASVVNELPFKVLTESETTGLLEEQQAPPVVTPPSPLASLDDSESDDLNDSPYSFKIHVLPPEEAKILYEEVQKDIHQVIDFQELTGGIVNNSAQNVTKEVDDPSKESVGLIRSTAGQIDQVCCLSKLLEIQSGLNRPSVKCQCKENNAKILIPVCDSPGKSLENDCQIISLSGPELCKIIDLTDIDNELPSPSDQAPMVISEESDNSQSDVGGNDKDDNLSNNETVFPNDMANVTIEMTEPADECAKEEFNSAEPVESTASDISVEQTEVEELISRDDEIDFRCLLMSDQIEDSEEAQLQQTDVEESSLKSKKETQIDEKATNQTSSSPHLEHGTLLTTRNRQSILDQYFPTLQEPKKVPVDQDLQNVSEQCSPSEVKTVELVLFGSATQNKGALSGNTKSHISALETSSYENIVPPPVLSVNLKSPQRNFVEAPRTPEYSAKKLIYERWRKSFPPLNLSMAKGHRKKWKIQRSVSAPLSTVTLKRKKLIPSAMKVSDGNGKSRLKLKRQSHSSELSSKEAKKRRYSVELETSVDEKRRNIGSESQDAMPLKENIILKFSVLPNTFSFMDGSTRSNETSDPISDKPELIDEKDRNSNKAVKSKVGQWYPSSQKQYQPLCLPRNVDLFSEYQKKYKDKNQPAPQELPDGRL